MIEVGSYRVAQHVVLGSTNDEAMALLRAGDPGDVFVVAERQTSGRGRRGRAWHSPPGNLHATLALRDPAPLAAAPQLGFVAGVALAFALRDRLRGDRRLRIKWPNDMLFDGAKLAGLLLESAILPDGSVGCVIGFGVNCVSHPDGLAYATTDLSRAAGRPFAAAEVLATLAEAMREQLDTWDHGAGFPIIRERWLGLAAGLGRLIVVARPHETLAGRLLGIDASGRLIVETDGGRVTIDAGDVFLPGVLAGAMNP